MTVEDGIEELASAIVVRAALFPLGVLDGLADDELADLADDASAGSRSAFEFAYEASMQRQHRALTRITIDDRRFALALCMTNEELSRRIADQRCLIDKSNKRARRLNATLYGYLVRAVLRPEPCDLWAGLTIAEWGEQSSVAAVPARYAMSPDLRPFQFIVQALAETPHYIRRGVFKLNPTLAFDEERQRWRYTVRSFSSIIRYHRAPSPGLDAVLRVLADLEPATIEHIVEEVRRHGVEVEALDQLISALPGLGLLVGGLAFPRRYASPWDALLAASRLLRDDHARQWRSASLRLRRLCRRLERTIESIAVDDLHDVLRAARSVPTALAQALGVEVPPLPRSVLRCDTRLPFSMVLGPETKERLARAVAEYDRYERHHGLDAAVRAVHRRRLLDGADARLPSGPRDGDPVTTLESAWRAEGADPLIGPRLAQRARSICAADGDDTCPATGSGAELALAPIAGLVLRPDGGHAYIVGTTTEICAAYGRYGQLWYGLASPSRASFCGHPVHEWYRRNLSKAAGVAGVDIVEYLGPCEAMPNLLARPEFQFPVWDRWGTESSYRADQLDIRRFDGTSVAFVCRDGDSRRIVLTCFSPANVGYSEPQLERLLLSSFREVPTWLDQTLPMECELATMESSPALRLPSGNYLRSRRTLLRGAELVQLVAASRPERFVRWRALARRYAWPSRVLVGIDGRPPLPVVRDSPLAVEVAFRGVNDQTRLVSVEELPDHTWDAGEEGPDHVVEFIVPFLRRGHAWSALASDQSGAPG